MVILCNFYFMCQLLEVIRLEGHSLAHEDAFMSRDIHLLQVLSSVSCWTLCVCVCVCVCVLQVNLFVRVGHRQVWANLKNASDLKLTCLLGPVQCQPANLFARKATDFLLPWIKAISWENNWNIVSGFLSGVFFFTLCRRGHNLFTYCIVEWHFYFGRYVVELTRMQWEPVPNLFLLQLMKCFQMMLHCYPLVFGSSHWIQNQLSTTMLYLNILFLLLW